MQKLEAIFPQNVSEIMLDSLTQWDKDVLLHISGDELPESFEIHMGYEGIYEALRFPLQKVDGIATIKIPNLLLQQTSNIKAWIYVIDSEGCRTTKTITIPLVKREKPVDYTSSIEPSQKDAVEQLVERTNDLVNSFKTTDGTVVSQNADFAEVAEWADGNPNNEDRTGYFVCANVPVNNIVMKKATSTDDVKGVTIRTPAFAGNYTKDKLDSNGNLLPKYSFVAVIGFVPVIDNGTCIVGGRCMPDDNGCAIPSNNSMGYQVINRIDENRVLIIIEPNGDMVQRVKTKINDLQGQIDDLEEQVNSGGSGGADVDQTYNPESENAQSGKAVAQALSRVKKIAFALAEDTEKGQLIISIGNYTNNAVNAEMSFFNPRLLCNGVDICNPMTADYFNAGSNINYYGIWNKRGSLNTTTRKDGYILVDDSAAKNTWSCVRYFQNDIVLKAGIYELSVEYFGNIEQLPTMEVSFEGTTISKNAPTITNVSYEKFRDVSVKYALEKGHIYLFSVKGNDSVSIIDINRGIITGSAGTSLTGLTSGIIVCADRCTCMALKGELSITNLDAFKNDKWDWTNGPYYITNFTRSGVDIWRI